MRESGAAEPWGPFAPTRFSSPTRRNHSRRGWAIARAGGIARSISPGRRSRRSPTAWGSRTYPYFTRNLVSDLGLVYGFGQLHQALEEGCDSFFEQECLVSVFADLFRRHGCGGNRVASAPRDQTLARKVVALMQERYAESLHLTDLANAAGLTNFQLIGLFKRTIGLTPHAYLIHVRLNMACRFLRRGTPLVQSALASGFCDQSALTKHFKRCYGITPLQFAAAARPRRQAAISANTGRKTSDTQRFVA